jgi:hypothetical protein
MAGRAQSARSKRSEPRLVPWRVLVDDGLATKLGDRVGVSRAAVRFRALSAA